MFWGQPWARPGSLHRLRAQRTSVDISATYLYYKLRFVVLCFQFLNTCKCQVLSSPPGGKRQQSRHPAVSMVQTPRFQATRSCRNEQICICITPWCEALSSRVRCGLPQRWNRGGSPGLLTESRLLMFVHCQTTKIKIQSGQPPMYLLT